MKTFDDLTFIPHVVNDYIDECEKVVTSAYLKFDNERAVSVSDDGFFDSYTVSFFDNCNNVGGLSIDGTDVRLDEICQPTTFEIYGHSAHSCSAEQVTLIMEAIQKLKIWKN